MRMRSHWMALTTCLALTLIAAPAMAADVASLQASSSSLSFVPEMSYDSVTLTVRGPQGIVAQEQFRGGQTPSFGLFDRAGNALPDGSYTYELRVTPAIDAQAKAALRAARERGDDSVAQQLREQNRLPQGPVVQSGHFAIADGAIVNGDEQEQRAPAATAEASVSGDGLSVLTEADQVIADDLIVQGSACVGSDCVNNENFGFDTIRLKENNLRIKFQDTSSSGSFPSVDWQLTANDSSSGGANKFSIDDIDSGKTPFTIEHSAPSNSLYVDDAGNIGMGTATPVLQMHVVDGNTPALRLEQDGSSGFTAQTWDLAGNEANFFVRDVTGGSKLPFRVEPGSPTNSLYVDSTGYVGVGTNTPDANLDIENNGLPFGFRLTNSATSGDYWDTKQSGSGYAISKNTEIAWFLIFSDGRVRLGPGGSGSETFFLQTNGDLAIAGDLTAAGVTYTSDVNKKQGFTPISGADVLSKLQAMPITEWSFKATPDVRHIGPMAQDFHAAFGVGASDKTIPVTDIQGVSLAAIQELGRRLEAKDGELESLRTESQQLQQRLAALEALLLSQQQ